MVHFDNLLHTTANGTMQDADSGFHKVVRVTKNIIIKAIELLKTIAPVGVEVS